MTADASLVNTTSAPQVPEMGLNAFVFVLAGYVVYTALIVVGIPANVFVLIRMIHFKRSFPEAYRNGTGACLMAMSVADLAALWSIILFCVLSFNIPLPISQFAYDIVCKGTIFSMHVATSMAIWSWLVMSILRWLALYRPLLHHTLYDLPFRAVLVVCFITMLTNCWLLHTVLYKSGEGCVHTWLFESETLTRVLLLVEFLWSFAIPIVIVAYLDLSTLISLPNLISKRYHDKLLSSPGGTHSDGDAHMKKSTRTLMRWLAIALVDILLNAPENVLRLAAIVGIVTDDDAHSAGYTIFKTISDVFYYSQYSFNAAYLALFIYDKCTSSAHHSARASAIHHSAASTHKRSTERPPVVAGRTLLLPTPQSL